MGRSRITEKGRRRRNRGKGKGKSYKPWIEVADSNSIGTGTILKDPISGRQMHFLSLAEKYVFYKLRWEEEPVDIREQYPLDLEETNKIAEDLGFLPAGQGKVHMTTDMLVTHKNGRLEAVSVKTSMEDIFAEDDGTVEGKRRAARAARKRQLLYIEKEYWKRRGVEFRLMFYENLDPIYVHNIESVMRCYDKGKIRDDVSLVKHMIARKIICVDMTKVLDFKNIAKTLQETGKGFEQWITQLPD